MKSKHCTSDVRNIFTKSLTEKTGQKSSVMFLVFGGNRVSVARVLVNVSADLAVKMLSEFGNLGKTGVEAVFSAKDEIQEILNDFINEKQQRTHFLTIFS